MQKLDILERLDERRRQEPDINELELLLLDAADEIERLREAVRVSPGERVLIDTPEWPQHGANADHGSDGSKLG